MQQKLKILGMDPSLNNWGLALTTFDIHSKELTVHAMDVINPVLTKGNIKQNLLDIEAAQQLYTAIIDLAKSVDLVIAEVPVGSQSARAMVSYATCTTLIGVLKAVGVQIIEVSPNQVKKVIGIKNASKSDVIRWVCFKHAEAVFPTYKRNGLLHISESKAEHMADAVVTIYAGMTSPVFKSLINSKAILR